MEGEEGEGEVLRKELGRDRLTRRRKGSREGGRE